MFARRLGVLELSLFSAAGLVAPDDELGWVHLHTSWLPSAGEGSAAGAGGGAVAEAAAEGAPVLRSTLRRSEVDQIHKDARFPPDWSLTLHYTIVQEELDGEPPEEIN